MIQKLQRLYNTVDKRDNFTTFWCAVVFISAFAGDYFWIPKSPLLNHDTLSHFLQVQDCLSDDSCYLRLGPFKGESRIGVSHGAIILHFFVTVFWLGGGFEQIFLLSGIAYALAITLVFLLGKKIYGLLAGFTGALICYSYWNPANNPLMTLCNISVLFLPSALFLSASICYIFTKKMRYLLAASFAAGIGIQLHLAHAVHVAGLIFLIAVSPGGSRFGRAFFSFGAVVFLIQIFSPAMLIGTDFNLDFLASQKITDGSIDIGRFIFVLLSGIAVSILFIKKKRLKENRNTSILFLLLCYLPFELLRIWLAPETKHYSWGLAPGISLLVISALISLWDLLPKRQFGILTVISLVFASIIWIFLYEPNDDKSDIGKSSEGNELLYPTFFNFTDARNLKEYLLEQEKWTVPEVFRHLRSGSEYGNFLIGLVYYSNKLDMFEPRVSDGRKDVDLAILKLKTSDMPVNLPSGWKLLNQNEQESLLLYQYHPYLDWNDFRICSTSEGGESPCSWEPVEYKPFINIDDRQKNLRAAYRYFYLKAFLRKVTNSPSLWIKIPIMMPAGASPRVIALPTYVLNKECTGAVVAVSGVKYLEKLPSSSVTVVSSDKASTGEITFYWDLSRRECPMTSPMYILPPVVEIDRESFNLYTKGDRTVKARPYVLSSNALNQITGSNLSEPDNTFFFPKTPKEPLCPLWYVITISFFLFLGLAASITICLRCS
ncbi:MAG: hypothetical protein FJ088_01855 [Deltaproteobacteria bacterium]|nr:hypothetical protein [Deltaproteobacteria bacterium]